MKELINYLFPNLKEYLINMGYLQFAHILELLVKSGLLILALPLIYKACFFLFQRYRKRIAVKDLHPFFTTLEVDRATKFYISTKYQNVSPSKGEEPVINKSIARQKLVDQLLNIFSENDSENERHFIILADSGMGKTTVLLNLYLKYRYKLQLIRQKYDIKIFPLGYSDTMKHIIAIKDKPNTILLLDAFDEDSKALENLENRLTEIINCTKEFRKIVITSRTHFFPTENEEPKETGLMRFGVEKGSLEFQKLYISPFDNNDILKYIRKRYSIFEIKRRKKAFEIIKSAPNLMCRPMLLNFIDDLIDYKGDIHFTYKIYEFLINKWIERETNRVPKVSRENHKRELLYFTKDMAEILYEKVLKNEDLVIYESDIKRVALKNNIKLSSLELKSRSLLNRNSRGDYKFAHKSIFEYFLALKLVNIQHQSLFSEDREKTVVLLCKLLDAGNEIQKYDCNEEVIATKIVDFLLLFKRSNKYSFDDKFLDNVLTHIYKAEYILENEYKHNDYYQFAYDFTKIICDELENNFIESSNEEVETQASLISRSLLLLLRDYIRYGAIIPDNMDICKKFILEMRHV